MISIADLPTLNATLNAISTILLLCGFFFVRQKKIQAHRACMIAALVTSSLFLTSYVVYHAHAGSKTFMGTGWIRPVYFSILISHIILAAAILPLAFFTVYRAWRANFEKHRRIARVTFPIWLYVSITGVVIYMMLY